MTHTIRPALLLVAAGLLLSTLLWGQASGMGAAPAAPGKDGTDAAAQRRAQKVRTFRRINERARANYLKELRGWATRYQAEGRDKRVPNDGNCPWLTETNTEQCVRTHVTPDFCDYFCVDIPQTEPSEPSGPGGPGGTP